MSGIEYECISLDPAKPSTIVIGEQCELAVYDCQMIVVPGEVLWVYRTDGGLVVAGFPEVTLQ